MAQFTLNWFAVAVMINSNATGQRALYRQKSVGGSFISTGFTPANDLPKTAQTVTSPALADNIVWEFKVQAICNTAGPTDNDNGIIEAIKFTCLTPVLTQTDTSGTIQINLTGLDITKVAFTLRKSSDNSLISGPTVVNKSGNGVSHTVTGLDAGTEYYWEFVLYSTINGVEVYSSLPAYLNGPCGSDTFETDNAICLPTTSLSVDSVEI